MALACIGGTRTTVGVGSLEMVLGKGGVDEVPLAKRSSLARTWEAYGGIITVWGFVKQAGDSARIDLDRSTSTRAPEQ